MWQVMVRCGGRPGSNRAAQPTPSSTTRWLHGGVRWPARTQPWDTTTMPTTARRQSRRSAIRQIRHGRITDGERCRTRCACTHTSSPSASKRLQSCAVAHDHTATHTTMWAEIVILELVSSFSSVQLAGWRACSSRSFRSVQPLLDLGKS